MGDVLEPGATFAGHHVERLVGRGGMAEVYLATTPDGEQSVALKVISPELARDDHFRRRFERESRVAQGLRHPHIVGIHEAGEHEEFLYMTMDYVDGPDLAQVLHQAGRLHPRHAALVVSQIGEALDAAAAAELVHRDVKPGNVFLEAEGEAPHAYLGDFGLSKHVSSTSGLTGTGQWVGTVDFASPEQIQGAEVDHRTDVYALGAVLYGLLTGGVAYPRTRDVDKLVAHISEPPPQPCAVVATIPAEFDAVIARAMAKQPEERYGSASELGKAALGAAEAADPAPEWSTKRRYDLPPMDPDANTVAG